MSLLVPCKHRTRLKVSNRNKTCLGWVYFDFLCLVGRIGPVDSAQVAHEGSVPHRGIDAGTVLPHPTRGLDALNHLAHVDVCTAEAPHSCRDNSDGMGMAVAVAASANRRGRNCTHSCWRELGQGRGQGAACLPSISPWYRHAPRVGGFRREARRSAHQTCSRGEEFCGR